MTISPGNKLILSEMKSGDPVPVREALEQLANAMEAVQRKGLTGDVDRLELFMRDGAGLYPDKYTIRDGYLFDSDTGKTVALPGVNRPIMVIRP
jgi:hypothetical protein